MSGFELALAKRAVDVTDIPKKVVNKVGDILKDVVTAGYRAVVKFPTN